ncbi:hypothetical protein [Asticcacaulis sp. AC466]|uniref:hypothetical protein n=1 Tax=Asticcacaulis sp. AC466 TaxID=1282362 RepID=UPI0004271DF6|nr:hypothetical protein [Asticcacaulis sp. AC466]
MKRSDMVLYGAEQLILSENAIEQALADTAGLASSLSRMRVDSRLSAVIGQDALCEVAEAITALTRARGAMVRAHGHLDAVKKQIGCGAVATGGGYQKPPGDGIVWEGAPGEDVAA